MSATQTPTQTSTETRSVVVEREIPYPPQKIWRALTQPHLIAEWLMKNDFQPVVGHGFKLSADWGAVDCQVQTVEPEKTLSYTWAAYGLESVVTWTLTPELLAPGGNPQIAKGRGRRAVQAYIAAMPGWKREVGRRLDALIARTVPGVHKAVKWNSPFYGVEGQGWFLSFHCFTKYVKVAFFRGRRCAPCRPLSVQEPGHALLPHPGGRPVRRGPAGRLGEAGQPIARRKNVNGTTMRKDNNTMKKAWTAKSDAAQDKDGELRLRADRRENQGAR
jgi:hypothetical protein